MKVTLTDLSRRSGYSLATISRVVNGEAGVREEVRAEVEKAISELGYLAKRPRHLKGVVEVFLHRTTPMEHLAFTPDGGMELGPREPVAAEHLLTAPWRLGNDFYRRILDGILDELRRHQRSATLHVAAGLDDARLRAALAGGTGSVLLVGETGNGLDALMAAANRPLVLADILHDGPCDQVTSDNHGGAGLAVAHCVAHGHRRVGFVGGPSDRAMQERREAFAFHAFQAGLRVEPAWVVEGDGHMERTAYAVQALLSGPERPTALVCCSDYLAMAVLRAAGRCGLAVPRDLSVTGFDDCDVASLATPAITSVHTDAAGIGRTAVRLLLSMAGAPTPGGRGCVARLPTRLMVRNSTGPAPG